MSRASTPMRSAIASAIAVDTPKPPFAALPPSPEGYGGQVGTRSRGMYPPPRASLPAGTAPAGQERCCGGPRPGIVVSP